MMEGVAGTGAYVAGKSVDERARSWSGHKSETAIFSTYYHVREQRVT